MKRILLMLILWSMGLTCFGQNSEFTVYSNGLIYSDTTVKQLKHIVDSMNLKFKTCDLRKVFYSKLQARAHYVFLDTGMISSARKDMDANMPFEEFIKKYPDAKVDKDLMVVKYNYKDYKGQDEVKFSSLVAEHDISFSKNLKSYNKAVKGKWIFEYSAKNQYSGPFIWGFYFTTEFENVKLPDKYGNMVQYSDCMVDTNSQLFKETAVRTGVKYKSDEHKKLREFMDYVHNETNKPIYDNNDTSSQKIYWQKFERWDSMRLTVIDQNLSKENRFKDLIKSAIAETIEKGSSIDEFEEYVGRYYSKKAELELKRGRIVYGGCSMDQSPRIHAMNIAVLSAETVSWETFLRAHLDIMNDRFQRASDGSYAWGARNTYIKELEELEINVPDLILGISLRVENPSKNHYYGNIGRLGRALAETRYASEIETKMLDMIKDQSLDNFNRIIIYYLFRNYNYYVKDEKAKAENEEKLRTAVRELPDFISSRLLVKK